jgi:hypothetical protein
LNRISDIEIFDVDKKNNDENNKCMRLGKGGCEKM